MKFVSLHHHSTYSYLDGYGTPEQHVSRATELGMGAIALTEHGNVSSHVRLEQAALAQGVKPLFGVELYTGKVTEDERTQRKNHLTILAETQEGYRNLLRLVSRGWAEGYYYEPTVSGPMLAEHREGLVVLSGCNGSLLATSIVGGKNIDPKDAGLERGMGVARRFKQVFGDNYYIELQAFPDLEKTVAVNKALVEISNKLKIPVVASLDVHYTKPDESEMQAILHNVRGGGRQSLEEQERNWGYDVKLTPPLTDRQLYDQLRACGIPKKMAEQSIYNTAEIAQRCTVTLPKIETMRYPLPDGYKDPKVLFRKWLNDGWKYRNINSRKNKQEYIERAKREVDLIEDKGFVDYFLVISDAVRFAKDHGIPVGPARGSAAASLVCYLLRITEVDPIPFPNLLFERFIDVNRHDLPDVDLDFDDSRRGEVRAYLVAKYGQERVGNIGTFTKYKGKNALDDIARVYKIPKWEVETVKELLLERSSGDLRASATIEDTVAQFEDAKKVFDKYPDLYRATKLEGNVRGMSVHAAGLVVANEPLTNACAVYTKTDKATNEKTEVISLDKYDAEYLNVLKIDALGLKTMGMIRIALEEIGMSLEELYALPLTDEECIKGFQESDVVGVFQFDGRAMRSVNSGVIPDNFMEICDVNALARPGPLHSGATGEYIDIKHGRIQPIHYHPIVDRITQHTNFQVVYQEQILQVVRELGNFSWEEAARIRKIIAKKRGEQEFNTMRSKFLQGAKTHGMNAESADKVFSMLVTAGAYAFNAAHCVSYGMLAYWTMWLKRHHPLAFYVAALQKYEDKTPQLLRDASRRGIEIKTLHYNKSGRTWKIDDGAIRAGFLQINGIGPKTADALLELRQRIGGFKTEADLTGAKGVGPKTLDTIREFLEDPDPFELNLLKDTIRQVRGKVEEMGLPLPTHTAAEVPYERTENHVAVTWLGVVRERNLKDLFELHHSRTGEHLDPNDVKDPNLNEWVVLTCEDDTDLLVVTIDRWRYTRDEMQKAIWGLRPGKDLILVKGIKKKYQARRAIYASEFWVIDPEEE